MELSLVGFFKKGISEVKGVMLSAAKNLRATRREMLRCAQHDRPDRRVSKKPTSESPYGGASVQLILHQPPQHRQQNPSVFVVGYVDRAIQAGDGLEGEG